LSNISLCSRECCQCRQRRRGRKKRVLGRLHEATFNGMCIQYSDAWLSSSERSPSNQWNRQNNNPFKLYDPSPYASILTSVLARHLFLSLRPTIKKNQKRKKKSTQRIMPAKRSVVEEADAGLRGRRSNGEISAAHVDHIELLSFLYPIPIRTFPNTFHNSITRSND